MGGKSPSIPEKAQTVQHDKAWALYSIPGCTQDAREALPLGDQEGLFLLGPPDQLPCTLNGISDFIKEKQSDFQSKMSTCKAVRITQEACVVF